VAKGKNPEKLTQGVKNLLGDPKKAIIKLSLPMMIGMIFQTLYNIADGIWVAGLGVNQLAAVGLFFPFLLIIMALGGGIGIGGSSAISRYIGAKNKKGADNTAIHTILLGLIIALLITLPLLPFLEKIFISLSGNKKVGKMTADYARILFGGAFILIFSNIANAVLRGEGDARRAMIALVVGSLLNMVLDPLYIYTFKMGIKGAAWATLTSMIVSAILFVWWIFIKKDTYLDITFSDFFFNLSILKEILKVGIPASIAQLSMSISMFFLNLVTIKAGGTDGVAIFTSGWRIVTIGIIPLLGMATAVTSVTGAAFGAHDKKKLQTAYFYAIKIGILIEACIAVAIFLFAPEVSFLFTYSEATKRISEKLVEFLRWMALFFPTIPLGMLTGAMFQGIGRGGKALTVTIFRTILLQVPIAYLLSVTLKMGLVGVWLGIITGNLIAVLFAFTWGKITIEKMETKFGNILPSPILPREEKKVNQNGSFSPSAFKG